MYQSYPDNYQCPFLSGKIPQERQCMSKAQMFALAQKSQVSETYTITFNRSLAAQYNGVYQITAVAGTPQYFILLTIDSKKGEHQFTSDQICTITLKGSTAPAQPPPSPPTSKCMTTDAMYTIVLESDPAETYNIYFKPPYDKIYNGIYHIESFAGDYSYFVLLYGTGLVFNSDQICAIRLRGPKVQKFAPEPGPEEANQITANTCWYQGQQYSPGARVVMNGITYTCSPDGVWR